MLHSGMYRYLEFDRDTLALDKVKQYSLAGWFPKKPPIERVK